MSTVPTKTLHGKGFKIVVPITFDEHFASNPIWVLKGKAAAEAKALRETAWFKKVGLEDEVFQVTAVQHQAFWVVTYWYTSQVAAKRKARVESVLAAGRSAADL